MSQSLPKEGPDKCSVSGHGSLNSISRHSSLKNRLDSPQIRKPVTAGRSKSFNNHRPVDPEVIAQVTEGSWTSGWRVCACHCCLVQPVFMTDLEMAQSSVCATLSSGTGGHLDLIRWLSEKPTSPSLPEKNLKTE